VRECRPDRRLVPARPGRRPDRRDRRRGDRAAHLEPTGGPPRCERSRRVRPDRRADGPAV